MTIDASKVDVRGPVEDRIAAVLTGDALSFLAGLHREFDARRLDLLARRKEREARLEMGGTLDFLPEGEEIRAGDWRVVAAPRDLERRRVEITGPTEKKLVINALNSGADGYLADFEDANSPTWQNMILGQANLMDAIAGKLEHRDEEGNEYEIADDRATLLVRPRGWHLDENHLIMDGRSMSASLVDAGLYLFHNSGRLRERGSGPYLYLPKLESHFEARLWNDALRWAEQELELDPGSIAVTVLIETVPAAFEMEEILYELRERPAALNAGRWDYIFSMIKCFRERPEFVLPDRQKVTMKVPFMRAYAELLVATCHRRGAHAMGGMAPQLPDRGDEEAGRRAEEKVREDKSREAEMGFDGTWVAHPDLVAAALEEFDAVLEGRPNQLDRPVEEKRISAGDLLDVAAAGGPQEISEQGLRDNVDVAVRYMASWLRGDGAAAIDGLMEDVATAEIARAQLWQWLKHGCALDDDREITRDLVEEIVGEELERIRSEVGDDEWFEGEGRFEDAREVFEQTVLSDEFVDFMTLPAYGRLS